MNQTDREQFEDMKLDIRGIKNDMHLLMTNHLPHMQEAIEEVSEKADQSWGMAESAEKASRDTKRFVIAGIAFMGIIIALIQCIS